MRRRAIALASVAAIAAVAATAGVVYSPDSFLYPDAFYYAEMGRQLQRGEGFTSLQGYPYLFSWLGNRGLPVEPPWPNVSRFPLVTIVYALAFHVGGATDVTVRAVGGCFFVATALATFLLGARLFGTAAGLLAAILFSTDSQQLVLGMSGLLETGAAFFLVAATLGVVATLETTRRWPPLALGALLGFAFLWRFDLLVLVPAAAVAILLRRGPAGWRPLVWTGLGFVLVVGPWVVRSLRLFDTPLAMLAIDRNLVHGAGRADPYGTTEAVDVLGLLTNVEFLREKAAALVWPFERWKRLFGVMHMEWLGPAVLAAGLVFRLRRHPAIAAWTFVVVAWLLRVALLSLMHHELRFYHSFTAVCFLLAFGAAAVLLGALPRPVRVAGALASLLVCVHFVTQLASWALWRTDQGFPSLRNPQKIRMLRKVATHTRPGSIVATWRHPEMVAWYGDRFVVDIEPHKIGTLEALGVRVDAVLHPAGDTGFVHRSLKAQQLFDDFVPTRIGHGWTLWVRPEAAALRASGLVLEPTRANRSAAGPHRTRPVPARPPALASAATASSPEPAAPRLVLLYAPCTVNASHLSPYAPDVFYTPSLDAFAKEAAVFERHQSESDQSGTAYAALLSGRGSVGHGVFSHPVRLAERLTLVTEAFAQAGWDVHFWAHQGMAAPRLGYAQGVPPTNVVEGRPLAAGDEEFAAILERLASDPAYRAMIVTNFTVTHYPYRDRSAALRDRFPEDAERLMAGLSPDDLKWARRTYTFRLDLQKDFPRVREELGLTAERFATLVRAIELFYVSDVAHLDGLFGGVVRAVDDAGLRDESLVVFTADHGEVLYRDNALFPWSHDFQLAPEVLRVPLLVRGAGVRPYRVQEVTRSIDVYPTVAALAGVPVRDRGVTGVSLAEPLRGQAAFPVLPAHSHTPKVRSNLVRRAQRSWGFFSRFFPSADVEHVWVSVRRGDLVAKWRKKEDGRFGFEVYDLAADPEERHDGYRVTDPLHRALANDLTRYKKALVAAHDAGERRSATPEIAPEQIEALRSLGYVE